MVKEIIRNRRKELNVLNIVIMWNKGRTVDEIFEWCELVPGEEGRADELMKKIQTVFNVAEAVAKSSVSTAQERVYVNDIMRKTHTSAMTTRGVVAAMLKIGVIEMKGRCPVCKNEFGRQHIQQKFCSRKCEKRATKLAGTGAEWGRRYGPLAAV